MRTESSQSGAMSPCQVTRPGTSGRDSKPADGRPEPGPTPISCFSFPPSSGWILSRRPARRDNREHACLRRRTRRDRDPNRTSRGNRRAHRRVRAGRGRGRAVPRQPARAEHHDHQVPLDRQHAAGAHHQPAGDGDLPRPWHRGPGQGGRDAARARRRHGVLHQHRGRGDRQDPHLGHPPRAGSRLPARQPVPGLRHSADLPGADPGQERDRARHPDAGSPPSTSAIRRTRMASPRRYETGSPARCTTSGPST